VRIIRLANFVAPHSGGLRTSLAELGAGYLAAGHEPVLVIPGDRDGDERCAQGRVITLRAPRVPFTGGYRVLWRRRRLARLLAALRPDALEVSDRTTLRWTGAWAREHGVPAVMVSHESVTALLKLTQSVDRIVAALRAAGAEVLTVRLPDPGQMFGLPGALARPLARRMHAVNAAVDEVARRYGTVHLDVARDPATYERRYWSVDRLHPNERGHRLIACRFHALLGASGFPVGPGPDPEPSSPPPTRLAEVHWMATKSTAWLVRRSRDLVPALVGLAVREWLGPGHEDPEPECTEPNYPEAESTRLERVNLNVLSKPSGNLQLYEC
jgi:hypothetical protein